MPRTLYQQDYCARGQVENYIKQVKCDLKSDRTSPSSYLANFARLLLTAAAYVLHQQLRKLGLQGTSLANAQPKEVFAALTIASTARVVMSACTTRITGIDSLIYWLRFYGSADSAGSNFKPFQPPPQRDGETCSSYDEQLQCEVPPRLKNLSSFFL